VSFIGYEDWDKTDQFSKKELWDGPMPRFVAKSPQAAVNGLLKKCNRVIEQVEKWVETL
jgi:hypothetical protein